MGIRESFLRKILGYDILWHGKNDQSAKVFSAKILLFTNLRKLSPSKISCYTVCCSYYYCLLNSIVPVWCFSYLNTLWYQCVQISDFLLYIYRGPLCVADTSPRWWGLSLCLQVPGLAMLHRTDCWLLRSESMYVCVCVFVWVDGWMHRAIITSKVKYNR